MLGLNRHAACLALAFTFVPQIRCDDIFSIHGSGTTNPSKCFWNIMSRIEDQSHAFTRLTYRAVGSGTGQVEFIGEKNTDGDWAPANDFGAGDIPLSSDDYDKLKDSNGQSTVIHLPFVVSGVSFFHSVPNVPKGEGGLNLTSCLLAQIFNGDIKTWDDGRILQKNPNLREMIPMDFPIKVAHRVKGSSSTKSITQYLNLKCPKHWSAANVNKKGSAIYWAPNSLDCDSSAEMTACIRKDEGTIGYIDSGHGWEEGLTEIELENADGNFVSSLESFNGGGTGVAATKATSSITSFDESFHDVSLLDQAGRKTWPILVMSYVYVRTDIDNFESMTVENLGLLRAFMKALYEPRYIDTCKNYGFTPVPEDVKSKALATLDSKMNFIQYDEWKFEDGIEQVRGQGSKYLSPKRRDYGEFERSKLSSDVVDLIAKSAATDAARVVSDAARVIDMKKLAYLLDGDNMEKLVKLMNATDIPVEVMDKDSGDSGNTQAAIVLASLSFAFWCAAILYLLVTKFCLNM